MRIGELADSDKETLLMIPTDENGPVDGFSDAAGSNTGEPDPGRPAAAPKPLSPEEYAELQKDARHPDEPLHKEA